MTFEFFLLFAIGAFAGGFINGLAGFGTALFTLGWWLQIMPPQQAVAVLLVMSVMSGISGLVLVWKDIQWRRLSRFLIPALLGVPIGLQLLDLINPSLLKLAIAGFLILYGGYFAFRKTLPNLTKPTRFIDAFIGFISGILGAVAGLSGALPTMWCSLRPWSKTECRAVLQPFNVTILGVSAALLAVKGTYTGPAFVQMGIAIPISLVSAQIGIWVFRKLEDHQFRRLLIILMLVSGLILMVRELL